MLLFVSRSAWVAEQTPLHSTRSLPNPRARIDALRKSRDTFPKRKHQTRQPQRNAPSHKIDCCRDGERRIGFRTGSSPHLIPRIWAHTSSSILRRRFRRIRSPSTPTRAIYFPEAGKIHCNNGTPKSEARRTKCTDLDEGNVYKKKTKIYGFF